MTDEQIIKALEWHSNDETHCSACPYEEHSVTHYCVDMVMKDALDLINRQKAEIESNKAKIKISAECIARQDKEIERLKAELKEDSRVMKQALVLVDEIKKEIAVDIETAKAEAVKEFAERLKDRPRKHLLLRPDSYYKQYVRVTDIDNLVKEMEGASDV